MHGGRGQHVSCTGSNRLACRLERVLPRESARARAAPAAPRLQQLTASGRYAPSLPSPRGRCCSPLDQRYAYEEPQVDGGAWFGIGLLILLWVKIAATLAINVCIMRQLDKLPLTGPAGTEMGAFTSTAAPAMPVGTLQPMAAAMPLATATVVPMTVSQPMAVPTGTPVAYASK